MATSDYAQQRKATVAFFCIFFINCNQVDSQSNEIVSQIENTKSYDEIKNNILVARKKISEKFLTADNTQKDSIILHTQNYLHTTITKELFPKWFGTEWDFNGISEIPGKGAVACGMFVTVILRDAGFNISRIKGGQLASEVLIKKLTKNIKLFSNAKMDAVINYIKNNPDGLYIVGLDTHVGFISKKGKKIEFIHSNYYSPYVKVMSQNLTTTSPLTDSKYRILGKLFDYEMTKKWILNEKVD